MQRKLDRDEVLGINSTLSTQGLKTKHVSGENYLKVLRTKNLLSKEIKLMIEGENTLAIENGIDPETGTASKPENMADFRKAMTKFHKEYSFELDLNFIPENELKEYTKELDTDPASVLFEYFLLQEDQPSEQKEVDMKVSKPSKTTNKRN